MVQCHTVKCQQKCEDYITVYRYIQSFNMLHTWILILKDEFNFYMDIHASRRQFHLYQHATRLNSSITFLIQNYTMPIVLLSPNFKSQVLTTEFPRIKAIKEMKSIVHRRFLFSNIPSQCDKTLVAYRTLCMKREMMQKSLFKRYQGFV